MNKKNLLAIALLIITVIYYLPIIKAPLAPYDEAVILVGAERVLNGEVPYKDFFTPYAPGQFYVLAALFKFFGTSVLVERIFDIIIKSLLSLCIFLMIRLLSSDKTAIAGWAMSLIWIEFSHFHAYPVYTAILLIYISVYLLLFYLKQKKPYYVILSALFIVGAIIFRHLLGGFAAVIIAGFLVLRRLTGEEKSWAPLISYMTTGVVASLPVIIFFWLNSDVEAAVRDLFIIPFDMVANQQNLPYPELSRYNLPFFVFPSVLLFGVITSFILIKGKKDNAAGYSILLISLAGVVFFNQLWGRSDNIHLLGVALTAILLSPILLHTWSRMLSAGRRLYGLIFVLFIIFFGITLSHAISRSMLLMPESYSLEAANPDIERAKYPLFLSPDLKKTIAYIKKKSSKDEYIYVGVTNHDQFVFNDAIIYFLAARNSATKYHEMNPGINTTAAVQEEMIDELKEKSVQLIVLVPRSRVEPNLSGVDTEVELLDRYIANNYALTEKYGFYEIWMKKNLFFR